MTIARLAVCCCSLLATAPALACFTVSSPHDRVIYHSVEPPVDMSLPLHETVPLVFPGGHMVFDLNTNCVAVPAPGTTRLPSTAASAGATVVRVLSGPDRMLATGSSNGQDFTGALLADLGPGAGAAGSR